MNDILDWICTWVSIIMLVVFVMYMGYFFRGSDIEYKIAACNEYCFHFAEKWASEEVGFYFNNTCICNDGSVGWFKS